jgi:transposase
MGLIHESSRGIVADMAAHPAAPLAVSESEAEALRAMTRAGTTEQRMAMRARIVLRAAEGAANVQVADELDVSIPTVLLWRRRFKERGLEGLADAPHPGRPRTYGRDVRERILAETLSPPEGGATHWSTRRLAKRVGVSAATVGRVWQEGRLKPHRTETFKYSRDPELVAKVTDVVGLYLQPPARAIVLSVDEKTQIQALDRTQPMLPLRPGQVERQTHDYKRHGITSLFAALEVGTGRVTTETRERHTGADFLAFMRLVARAYPRREVHVILDNVSTHKTPEVQEWLARHKRFVFHFTPTSASWMNQVETWFSVLTRQAIRRGSFESVRALVAAIERFTREWNAGATPFTWVKTADQILAKAVRKTQADSGAGH